MDRVDEILFLYEDDRVEMKDGGKSIQQFSRTVPKSKIEERIKNFEKQTGLKFADQNAALQKKIKYAETKTPGRNIIVKAFEQSPKGQALIKEFESKTGKKYSEQTGSTRKKIRDGDLKYADKTLKTDPTRAKEIDDYVNSFKKEYGYKPTEKEVVDNFKKTKGKNYYTQVREYNRQKGLPSGKAQGATVNVDNAIKKLLKSKQVTDVLEAGKMPTDSVIKNILKVDQTTAEARSFDLAKTLTGERKIRKFKAPTKYKTVADNYLKNTSVDMFKNKRARNYYETGLSKLLALPKNIRAIRRDILNKITNIIPELKGQLAVDEIAGITSSMRRGSGPYAIFAQVIGNDFNTEVKGAGIDSVKGRLESKLVNLSKDDPQRIDIQKKYNSAVTSFENKANKNNPVKKVKGLKLSFEPPSKTIKNKKVYNKYKDLFDAHYKTYGYSFEVPGDRDSIVDISEKLNKKPFQNLIKNRFKNLIGKGGKLGLLAGMGTLAGSGFALADEALAADGTEARSILPEVAGGAAAGSLAFKPVRQGVKKGLKATGRLLGKLAVPIGLGAEAYFAKQAYDEGKSIPEIMAAPFLLEGKVRQAQDMLRMKPEERQAVNREMIEEDFSGLSSDFDTPTLEGVDDVNIEEVKERVLQERLADEARRREERKAGGGIAGLSGGIDEGPPPESGPNPQGLENLKYYVTNT